jgi:hypothetical protein
MMPGLPAREDARQYQAYECTEEISRLHIRSVRRLGDVMLMTADDRWLALPAPARQDLVQHLARHLLSWDHTREILILDRTGRLIASAADDRSEVSGGGR